MARYRSRGGGPLRRITVLGLIGGAVYVAFQSDWDWSNGGSCPRAEEMRVHLNRSQRRPTPAVVRRTLGCRTYPCIVTYSPGGLVGRFEDAANALIYSGGVVIIDGGCNSACPLLADIARENVCMTSCAVFGFHRMSYAITNRRGQKRFVGTNEVPEHSEDVHRIVDRNGGFARSDDLNRISYRKFTGIWRMCTEKDWSGRR